MHSQLVNLLKNKSINTIIEVGARDCIDTIYLYENFNKPKIYSYECNPMQTEICLNNLKKINYINNIIFCNYGLGNIETTLPFYPYIYDNNIGASSFLLRDDSNYTQSKISSVPIKILYDEIDKFQIKNIDLLIMDVQGYELNILLGLKEYINIVSYIVLEIPLEKINPKYLNPNLHSKYIGAPTRKEIIDYMKKNNFSILAKFYENELEENIVFINNNKKN